MDISTTIEIPQVEVTIRAGKNSSNVPAEYKTIVLKPNMSGDRNILTQEILDEYGPNTKFVIKYEYYIDSTVTVPERCSFEFDGGSFKEGTLVGNNTKLINLRDYPILDNVTKGGTFEDVVAIEKLEGGYLANTGNIVDETTGKSQAEVNADLQNAITSGDEHLAEVISATEDSLRENILSVNEELRHTISETESSLREDISTKANAADLSTHTGNSDIHVTIQNKTAWNAKYDKPSGGIPQSDLNASVQAVLMSATNEPTERQQADAALQLLIQQITNSLINYYTKSETYNRSEINDMVAAVGKFQCKVVSTLPEPVPETTGWIYLVPSDNPKTQNIKEEYITVLDGSTYKWEHIGSTNIDLSPYSTTEQMGTAISNALKAYTTTADLTGMLAGKQDVINDLGTIRSGAAAGSTAYQKPSGGIPKSDLNSNVQTSLGKADTALQSHQDISGKADKATTVTNVAYDTTNKKLTKTINGSTTDIVTTAKLKEDMALTKGDVGLSNVTNDAQVKRTEMGSANGVAQLGSDGKVPSSQLPSYVDDVLEFDAKDQSSFSDSDIWIIYDQSWMYQLGDRVACPQPGNVDIGFISLVPNNRTNPSNTTYWKRATTFPETGESGKIYVALDTNKTYRWSGSAYVEISPSLVLGETYTTAYRGDRGKAAYDHTNNSDVHVTTAQKTSWDRKSMVVKYGSTFSDDLMTQLYNVYADGGVALCFNETNYCTGTLVQVRNEEGSKRAQFQGLVSQAGSTWILFMILRKNGNTYEWSSQTVNLQEAISDLSTIRSGASAGKTAYQKPSDGIPKSDLASAVQTSLGKADTALQSTGLPLTAGTGGSSIMHVDAAAATAQGAYAEGVDTYATGIHSHAEGIGSMARNDYAHSEGDNTEASGIGSHTEGKGTKAQGNYAHAEGESTVAGIDYSHAEGAYSTTSGIYAHAEGFNTTASGQASHAEGSYTTASALFAHAEGNNTTASGKYSHTEGLKTEAVNDSEHASGKYNISRTGSNEADKTIFSVGNGTKVSSTTYNHNAFEIRENGDIYIPDTGVPEADYSKPMIKLQEATRYTIRGMANNSEGGAYQASPGILEAISCNHFTDLEILIDCNYLGKYTFVIKYNSTQTQRGTINIGFYLVNGEDVTPLAVVPVTGLTQGYWYYEFLVFNDHIFTIERQKQVYLEYGTIS